MIPVTVEVDSAVRDQLIQMAAASGLTVGGLITNLIEEHLEREILAEAKRRILATPPEAMVSYMREFQSLDPSLTDGLENYAGEYDQVWSNTVK